MHSFQLHRVTFPILSILFILSKESDRNAHNQNRRYASHLSKIMKSAATASVDRSSVFL
jgi:hypothetical protein